MPAIRLSNEYWTALFSLDGLREWIRQPPGQSTISSISGSTWLEGIVSWMPASPTPLNHGRRESGNLPHRPIYSINEVGKLPAVLGRFSSCIRWLKKIYVLTTWVAFPAISNGWKGISSDSGEIDNMLRNGLPRLNRVTQFGLAQPPPLSIHLEKADYPPPLHSRAVGQSIIHISLKPFPDSLEGIRLLIQVGGRHSLSPPFIV